MTFGLGGYMNRNDPVIIVGGGLGGLTTALALARHGWSVNVLEGAPEFGAIGFGIQFGPNVFHALDRIGVSAAVLEKADMPSAVLMIDAFTGKEATRTLQAHQAQLLLAAGNPESAEAAPVWRRVS